eukprot:2149773-Rhodomonas_salina.1
MVKNSMEDGEGDLMVDTPAYQVWHSLVSPLAPSWPLHSILHHYNLPPAPTLHNVGTFVIFLAVLQVYLSSLFVSASHPRLKPPHNNRFFGRRERFAASIVSIPQKSSMLSGQTRKHLPTACLNRCASPSRASSRRLRCLQNMQTPEADVIFPMQGNVTLVEDGRGSYEFRREGVHMICDPFYTVGDTKEFDINTIVHGDRVIL